MLIAIMEIILYALTFQTHWSVHIALFACVYGFCTFCEKLVKNLTRKERLYDRGAGCIFFVRFLFKFPGMFI